MVHVRDVIVASCICACRVNKCPRLAGSVTNANDHLLHIHTSTYIIDSLNSLKTVHFQSLD